MTMQLITPRRLRKPTRRLEHPEARAWLHAADAFASRGATITIVLGEENLLVEFPNVAHLDVVADAYRRRVQGAALSFARRALAVAGFSTHHRALEAGVWLTTPSGVPVLVRRASLAASVRAHVRLLRHPNRRPLERHLSREIAAELEKLLNGAAGTQPERRAAS